MNRAHRRAAAKSRRVTGRRVAAGAALAAASLMSTYMAAIRPPWSYASAQARVQARSAPLIPVCGQADDTVTTAADLRAAVTASADDSIICVSGTIDLTGSGGPIWIPELSTLTIVGAGSGATITGPTDDSGIFRTAQTGDNPDDTLTFSNLTLQNGWAPRGGAIFIQTAPIYAASDTLVIDDVRFIDNQARHGYGTSYGGAIYANRLRSVVIINSTFTGNSATARGGAVWARDISGDVVIDGSTFEDNVGAACGGAVCLQGPLNGVELRDSTFTGNSAAEGGAVDIPADAGGISFYASGNIFQNNTASAAGGLLARGFQEIRTVGNVFEDNSAGGAAGAYLAASSGSIEILDDSFVGNSATGGTGALSVRSLTATIYDSYFERNDAGTGLGGALSGWAGDTLTLSGNHFARNAAESYGGAVYVKGTGDVDIRHSVFSENYVTRASGLTGGGALTTYNQGDVSISDTSFVDNTSTGVGGAIFLFNDGFFIRDSTFSGNSASAGGAVTVSDYSGAREPIGVVTNSTLVNNTATDARTISGYQGGGAILGLGARLTLNFVTITGNHSDDSIGASAGAGGGIHIASGLADDQLTITNSVIAGNTADSAGADIGVSDSRVPTVIDHAAVTAPSALELAGPSTTSGVLFGSLASLLLGPLQDNGGPTETMVPLAGSPVIDAGNPSWAPPPQDDQRGSGFPRKIGPAVDLGAVESDASPNPGPGPGPGPSPVPPSPPSDVVAVAGNRAASVSWSAPVVPGSFPVSNYRVTAVPGGRTCLTATLTCSVEGLENGATYIFTVKALSGAGWSQPSAPSNPVTPGATPQPTPAIVISGTRTGRGLDVRGSTRGIDEGSLVTPWLRKAGAAKAQPGRRQAVDPHGRFEWKRRVSSESTVRVYVTLGDLKSNVVRLPASPPR